MIIRKPYAFLIKNFKKIHIALLIVSLYLAYKVIEVNSFVNEFMSMGIYDLYANPITRHITFIMNISIIFMIIGSASLLLLLRHKNKPWKLYLIPLINYVALFFIMAIIKGFFKTYTISVDAADLRFARDLLVILVIVQLPVVALFIMRTFGLDINKFNFNSDEEFLQLSEEDREEIEISFDIDVNTFKRMYRRFLRNVSYFYEEHKLVSRIVIGILSFILLLNIYTLVFVTNKSYKETDNYKYNNFTIKVNNSYFTNKDYKGDVISKSNNFVVVSLTIKNNSENARSFDTSRFHLKAGNLDYTTTESTFGKEFYDLGKTYNTVSKIGGEETFNFIIVYKVDSKIDKDRFVLFFQEKGNDNILRKIKLKLVDLSKNLKEEKYKVGDNVEINVVNKEDEISIDSYLFTESFNYSLRKCVVTQCYSEPASYTAPVDNKVLILEFASGVWESTDFVDFLSKCAIIHYIDIEGNERDMDINFAVKTNYLGKVAYIVVPNEVENSEMLQLRIKFRNREMKYILK